MITDVTGSRGKAWRAVVAAEALAAMQRHDRAPFHGPLKLEVEFILPRPKGHRRPDGTVRTQAPAWPDVRPDATKLLRALEDACTRIVWHDDAQIVLQLVAKKYGDRCGAQVTVTPL